MIIYVNDHDVGIEALPTPTITLLLLLLLECRHCVSWALGRMPSCVRSCAVCCDRWFSGLCWPGLLHQFVMQGQPALSHCSRTNGNPASEAAAVQFCFVLWTYALSYWRQQRTELCDSQFFQSKVSITVLLICAMCVVPVHVFSFVRSHYILFPTLTGICWAKPIISTCQLSIYSLRTRPCISSLQHPRFVVFNNNNYQDFIDLTDGLP